MSKLFQYNGKKWIEIAKDGKTPVAGIDFKIPEDGKTPIKGLDYFDGKDGSPDTPNQVIEKINISDKKINKSKIEGLEEQIIALQRSIRESKKDSGGGGGGMGNMQHQSFNVSSSTTTIMTSFTIGGGGFAIWAYYNGQFIVRGNHYSVGSNRKTLTLQFTPQDGTVIDLVYMRG